MVNADADLDDRDTLFGTPSESPFPDTFSLLCASSSSSETDDPAETFSPKIVSKVIQGSNDKCVLFYFSSHIKQSTLHKTYQ